MFSSENKDYPIIFPEKNPKPLNPTKLFLLVAEALLSSASDPQSTDTAVLCVRISHPGLLLRCPLHLIIWSIFLLRYIGLADFCEVGMSRMFIQFRVSLKQRLSAPSAYSITVTLIFLVCAFYICSSPFLVRKSC